MIISAACCGTLDRYMHSPRDFNKESVGELASKCRNRDMHDMVMQTMAPVKKSESVSNNVFLK